MDPSWVLLNYELDTSPGLQRDLHGLRPGRDRARRHGAVAAPRADHGPHGVPARATGEPGGNLWKWWKMWGLWMFLWSFTNILEGFCCFLSENDGTPSNFDGLEHHFYRWNNHFGYPPTFLDKLIHVRRWHPIYTTKCLHKWKIDTHAESKVYVYADADLIHLDSQERMFSYILWIAVVFMSWNWLNGQLSATNVAFDPTKPGGCVA